MKAFANVNPRTVAEALDVIGRSRAAGRTVAVAGGGTDLLGMMKERLVEPDVLVHLRTVAGHDRIARDGDGLRLGGLVTLASVAADADVGDRFAVLAQASGSVGTPQIRNAATLAGNVCQRPWCWYLRNGFPCYKNGGSRCFAASGENQFHAIFGGGPSYIVHPSDTAPALLALDARFRIAGPRGERVVAARDFFALPGADPSRENVLADDEIVVDVAVPATWARATGVYRKLLDRASWTHAVVSAAILLRLDGDVCRGARIVLGGVAPIPWDLPRVARLLEGQPITAALAARAGELAVEGARPLTQNGYKVPLTKALVRRTLLELAGAA